MMMVYGTIRLVDEDYRMFTMKRKNQIEYFYLSRNQMKKYSAYLQKGLFVYVKVSEQKKLHHHHLCYDVIQFVKMIRRTKRKMISYYDIDTIQEGVVNLLNQEHNRMFLDLEFTMPPFSNEAHQSFNAEIIQYGIYIENIDGEFLDCDSALVRPINKLGLNTRTFQFLHVNPSAFRKAISYHDFYNNLKYFMETYNPVIYVWGKNDMLVIENSYVLHNVKPITKRKDYINLMQIMKNYYGIKYDIGLFKAVQLYDEKSKVEEQEHNALDDAYMTMKVFHMFKKDANTKKDNKKTAKIK